MIHAAREAVDVADVSSLVALDGADLDGLSVEVRAGSPSTVIVEQLERPGVELLVLTTVAAGDPDRDLGSVALNVTINTTRPILWLRPEAGLEKSETAPPISRLLVPLDGTHATAWALKPVTALAARLGASVDVLYVVSAAARRRRRRSSRTALRRPAAARVAKLVTRSARTVDGGVRRLRARRGESRYRSGRATRGPKSSDSPGKGTTTRSSSSGEAGSNQNARRRCGLSFAGHPVPCSSSAVRREPAHR